MKSHITSSLILGIFSILSLYHIVNVSAELSAQDQDQDQYQYPAARQTFPLASRASRASRIEYSNGDLRRQDRSVKSAAGSRRRRIFKRARRWTSGEERLLLELRDKRQLSWGDMVAYFQNRNWRALESKYALLKEDRSESGKKKTTGKRKTYTEEEKARLIELRAANTPWEEIAEALPGRDAQALKSKHYRLTKGSRAPQEKVERWTTEEDNFLLQLGEEEEEGGGGGGGLPRREIVTRFNARFGNRTFDAIIARYGILNPTTKNLGFTSEEEDELIEALNLKMSVKEISQLFERSERAIRNRIIILEESGRIEPAPQIAKSRPYTTAEFELMDTLSEIGMFAEDTIAYYFPGRPYSSVKGSYRKYRKRKERDEQKE